VAVHSHRRKTRKGAWATITDRPFLASCTYLEEKLPHPAGLESPPAGPAARPVRQSSL